MLKHSILLDLELELDPSFSMKLLVQEVNIGYLTALEAIEFTAVSITKMLQLDAVKIVCQKY